VEPGTVTVRGTAAVPGRPDRVEIALSINVLEPAPDRAMAEATRRADALSAVLEELAIPKDAWSTSGVGVGEVREWEGDRQVHRGYRATYRVAVRLIDHELVGRLLREAIERAGAEVAGPWWRIDPENPARLEACRLAAVNARHKAEVYAGAVGARIGAAVLITEPEVAAGQMGGFAYMPLSARAGGAPEMEVQPGQLDVTVSVDVAFRLEAPGAPPPAR
jgi:uncharacterized protein YggE